MSSIAERIDKAVDRIGTPTTAVDSRHGERIYNLLYDPAEWSRFKQLFPKLLNRFREIGFTPFEISFAECVQEVLENNRIIQASQKTEGMMTASHEALNEQFYRRLCGKDHGGALSLESPIIQCILRRLDEAQQVSNPVAIFTAAEVLHPVLRISAFEQVLQGKIPMPVLICYPGKKGIGGGRNPSFLGIHRPDGNYRSTFIDD